MIILGDIASPTPRHSIQLDLVFTEHSQIFKDRSIVCNFEGLINDEIDIDTKTPVLFNHSSVLDVLLRANCKAVGLANNHILDLPENFISTIEKLSSTGIKFVGASLNFNDANKPVYFFENGKKVFLFNHCWDFLLYHQKNPTKGIHVATINEPRLIKMISEYRRDFPDAAIIVFLHWSFDLETLPFPMYRQLARMLIDKGANVIAGSHSHCVQGAEKYNNGYIVYGLGNFFLPDKAFAGSYLTFPDFARIQLAFEWNSQNNEALCHWFEYQLESGNHKLNHLESSKFKESALLKKYSEYSDISLSEYKIYFQKNRRKKFLIPIYTDYRKKNLNRIFTFWLKLRARVARVLARFKIIKWQR